MSLLLATEFVEHCITQNQYFSAKELYLLGMKFGITNSEVYDNFLGKNRAVSRGKYIPAYISSKKLKYAQAQAEIKRSKFAVEQLRKAKKTGGTIPTTFSKSIDAAVDVVQEYERADAANEVATAAAVQFVKDFDTNAAMTPLPTTSN